MGFLTITNTFTNSTTADATQVNANFTDVVNATSDGTKNFNISALTCSGTVTLSAPVTLGASTVSDIIFTGSLASSIPIKTTFTYDIGSADIGIKALYFGDASGTGTFTTKLIGADIAGDISLTLPATVGTSGDYLRTDGAGAMSWSTPTQPTIQKFLSGSGNYTTPAGVKWLRVRAVGSGAGGQGSGTTAGTAPGAGNATTFGTSLINAGGGAIGAFTGAGGLGGTGSLGTAIGLAIPGGQGGGTMLSANSAVVPTGSPGGATPLFNGAGAPGAISAAGGAGTTNTGGGGAGGACTTSVAGNNWNGSGGGSGAYVEGVIYPTALQIFAYAVGAAGTAGGAGVSGFAGGAGGSGIIIVEEHYV